MFPNKRKQKTDRSLFIGALEGLVKNIQQPARINVSSGVFKIGYRVAAWIPGLYWHE
jgi:hypothetical protein